METIGEIIKQKRKEQKYSQSELAVRVGCERANICNIENGKSYPSLRLAVDIAKVLDLDLDLDKIQFKGR